MADQTVLPAPLRGPTIDAEVLTTLAQGCRDTEITEFDYSARDSASERRQVEPHRLVSLGQRWYLVAYDRRRDDWRIFRVDRIHDATLSGRRFTGHEPPAPDALAFVRAGIKQMPRRYDVRVLVHAPRAEVATVVGRWAELHEVATGTLMTMPSDDLFWPRAVLATIEAALEVQGPDELEEQVACRFAIAGR